MNLKHVSEGEIVLIESDNPEIKIGPDSALVAKEKGKPAQRIPFIRTRTTSCFPPFAPTERSPSGRIWFFGRSSARLPKGPGSLERLSAGIPSVIPSGQTSVLWELM